MRFLALLGLVATAPFIPAMQALSGRWSAAPQPGTTIILDLSVDGTIASGTMIVTGQGGRSLVCSVERGRANGTTLSLTMRISDQTVIFVGELHGEELWLRTAEKPETPSIVFKRESNSPAPAGTVVSTPPGWRSTERSASLVQIGSRTVLNVAAAPGEGVVWHEQSLLQDGTIDVELRGRDVVGQSFLGVAFRGLDDRTYEAVYFRPFNFATIDPDRRLHAVQYHSSPDNPWAKLRAEHPNQYEKAIAPVPDPNDWFRVRIILDDRALSVFVNDAATPTLTLTTLAVSRRGMVGVWLGNGSGGEFANLKVTPVR